MCDRKGIGDEYRYIMECTYSSNERKRMLPSRFHKNHNTFKFKELKNSGNIETLKSLSRLIKKILNNDLSVLPDYSFHDICMYFVFIFPPFAFVVFCFSSPFCDLHL